MGNIVGHSKVKLQTFFCGDGDREFVSRARLLPFLRSDGGEGVWSIELTFLSQLRNLAAGVGMKIRPHVNCEYCYYYLFYICVKN